MNARTPFSAAFGTRFLLSVDTEEEFEWGGGFTRDTHGIASTPALARAQRFFRAAGVNPLYFVDYPVAQSDAAIEAIGPAVTAGEAHVGAHLHPWVTPPFVEALSSINSYAGNLPRDVERAKLSVIRDRIRDRLGVAPLAYRAGRYGIGPNTLSLLSALGFRADSSRRPLFDYRGDGGPDFTRASPHAAWGQHDILELPLTSVLAGRARAAGPGLYRMSGAIPFGRGALARAGLMQRIAITPEGVPAHDACAAIDLALADGVRLISISFHSPSLAPGHTPYVRDEADLSRFYHWFEHVFEHLARAGVAPASLAEVLADADATRGAAPACHEHRASATAAA